MAVPFLFAACVTIERTTTSADEETPTAIPSEAASVAPSGPTAAPTSTPTPTVTPAPPVTPVPTFLPVKAEVFGFLPYFLLDDAVASIQPELLSTVAWLGVEASGEGRLVEGKPSGAVPPGWEGFESEAFRKLQTRLQEAGVRVVLVIQRFGWSAGGLERTESLLKDPESRARLARQIAAIVAERGLDGVNLDFEPMPEGLADEYVDLVREVRAALDGVDAGLHLSVDVHSSVSGYDLAALTGEGAADAAVIMGYEYRGASAKVAGSDAPLVAASGPDLSDSLEEALSQVPPERLILALPWYGRAWSTESAEPGSATVRGDKIEAPATIGYALAAAQAESNGRAYETGQESAWTAYPSQACASCPSVWRQTWYDDPDSFGAKVDHALGRGLAGVGIWALGYEAGRPEMWWALRERLEPGLDEAGPNGSASLDPKAVVDERNGRPVVSGLAPILSFAEDEQGGSGLAFVRAGLEPDQATDGALVTGRTFPATERIELPLGDPQVGGSAEPGPRDIHVQWRDVAGNWSTPLVIEVWAADPAPAATPEAAP